MGEIIFYCGIGAVGIAIIMLIVFAFRKLHYDASDAAVVKNADLEVSIPGSDETVTLQSQPKPVRVTPQGVNYEVGADAETDSDLVADENDESEKASKEKKSKKGKPAKKKAEKDSDLKTDSVEAEETIETDVTEDPVDDAETDETADTADDSDAADGEDTGEGTEPEPARTDEPEMDLSDEALDAIDVRQEIDAFGDLTELDGLLFDDDDTNGTLDSELKEGVVSE